MKQVNTTYTYQLPTSESGNGSFDFISQNNIKSVIVEEVVNKIKEKYGAAVRYVISSLNISEPTFTDSSTGKTIGEQQAEDKNKGETTNDQKPNAEPVVNNIPEAQEKTEVDIVEEITDSFQLHTTWDPRLYRRDEFFEIPGEETQAGKTSSNTGMVIRAPFASNTIATAFSDLSNIMEGAVIQSLIKAKQIASDSEIGKLFGAAKESLKNNNQKNNTESTDNQAATGSNSTANQYYQSDMFITHTTKDYENDSGLWGAQSLVNPYSLTKLVGGIDKGSDGLINYMYDIRDQRRFYDVNGAPDLLSISNPTVTQLIQWSNADMWGRTPYAFQDFVYCKYFGLIPNNRLITLRRYIAPTYDNLQFENMFGAQESTTTDSKGKKSTEKQNTLPKEPAHKTFAPKAYVVTWFGGDTGNSLNSLMSFTTGINWGKVESQMWNVTGNDGESKQAVVDRLLGDGGGHLDFFGGAEYSPLSSLMQGGSYVASKWASLAKFNLAMTKDIGQSQDVYDKLRGANVDPYEATFRNRVEGPINRITEVKKRDPGIEFSQSLAVKCTYKSKAIGGINPKAALLDILGNCLEMVSPHAVFWGGGFRFQVRPQMYPFHDGGWRDNTMARMYEGKFLGNDGAIATALSGFKKAGENNSGGGFNMDTFKGVFAQMGGSALGILGNAISSLSDVLGGVDFLDNFANSTSDAGQDLKSGDNAQKAGKAFNQLFSNLNSMWHSRMLAETSLPQIQAGGNLLVGEPVGEWHLTIGNPLNPIMVVGNLICKNMKVDWGEEIGPDDFPTEFSVTYNLEHAMARDNDAIQSMFNKGMGKYYTLPDYIKTASDRITYVDKFTKDAGTGDVGTFPYKSQSSEVRKITGGIITDQKNKIPPGNIPNNHGNYNTQLITKFNGINTEASRSVMSRQQGSNTGVIARVRSLAATRKLINN